MVYPETHAADIMAMDVSDDGDNLISADLNGRVILWDLQLQKPLRIWNIPGSAVSTKISSQDLVAFVVTVLDTENEELTKGTVKISMLNLESGVNAIHSTFFSTPRCSRQG